MIVTVQFNIISGTLHAPASKSAMQRACAAALLHDGKTIIKNPGKSNDDLAAMDVIQKLGAKIKMKNRELVIDNSGRKAISGEINCGESGLGIRMFTPLAALNDQEIIINGMGSLLSRPMDFFDEIFPQLGISIQSNNGKLPLKIKGPLQPKDITVDGSLSSQFLTGLLFAFGKAATRPVTITVSNLKSKPYIDLTLQVMKHFGYNVGHDNYEKFFIQPSTFNLQPLTYTVEGDWSGAAFLLVAGAIGGGAVVKGLDINSAQADKAIMEALALAGADISITEDAIDVSTNPLRAFHFNATDCPDLFPPLVALAAHCHGTTVIEGVSRLKHKESDRALTLQEEFGKLGIKIMLEGDRMLIDGGEINGGIVHSRHDHRIAMACAVAAVVSFAPVTIHEAEAVNKSYPGFYDDLARLGATVYVE